MLDGYNDAANNGADYSDLDELLTEYVDGTMDPAVRVAFEQLMLENPALAEHVRHLQETRALLCHMGCKCAAPSGFQTRLRCQLACELHHESQIASIRVPAKPHFLSAMALAALFLLTGNTLYHSIYPESDAVSGANEAVVRAEAEPIPEPAIGTQRRAPGLAGSADRRAVAPAWRGMEQSFQPMQLLHTGPTGNVEPGALLQRPVMVRQESELLMRTHGHLQQQVQHGGSR